MANGRQLGKQNVEKFLAWLASRGNDDLQKIILRGALSRREIAAQCGFSVSVLNQNPRIKAELSRKEANLRKMGILPGTEKSSQTDNAKPHASLGSQSRNQFAGYDELRQLELENSSLKAENYKLKRQLDKLALLHEILATTGRLPR